MSSLLRLEKYANAQNIDAMTDQGSTPVMYGVPAKRPGVGDMLKTLYTGGGNGIASGIRGLTGAGVGALAGKLFGGSAGKGALIGAGLGLLPDIIRHAPKVLKFVKGLFTKQSAVVFDKYFSKQAAAMYYPYAGITGLNGDIDVSSANLNKIEVPEGALPPVPLLLPQVVREGTKAQIKSTLKNLGIGTAAGAGLGVLAKLLHNGDSSKNALLLAALGGGALGLGGGAIGAAWNAPDARIAAMLKKHKELHKSKE